MHFWDSDPTEQITTKVPIRHEQPVIKSITKGDVKKNKHTGKVRLGYNTSFISPSFNIIVVQLMNRCQNPRLHPAKSSISEGAAKID